MNAWLLERIKNGWFYALITLVLGFLLYSAFLKPTNKTVNTAPSSHEFDNASVHVYPCGKFFTYGK